MNSTHTHHRGDYVVTPDGSAIVLGSTLRKVRVEFCNGSGQGWYNPRQLQK